MPNGHDDVRPDQTRAREAYQELEIQQLVDRTVRAAGRSATPAFLEAVGRAIIAHAAKGASND